MLNDGRRSASGHSAHPRGSSARGPPSPPRAGGGRRRRRRRRRRSRRRRRRRRRRGLRGPRGGRSQGRGVGGVGGGCRDCRGRRGVRGGFPPPPRRSAMMNMEWEIECCQMCFQLCFFFSKPLSLLTELQRPEEEGSSAEDQL